MMDKELQERQQAFEEDISKSEYFKDSLRKIKYDYLTVEEKEIYDKIMAGLPVSKEEFQKLYSYVSDYEQAVHEIRPDEIKESTEKFSKLLQTEEELINFLEHDYTTFKFAPRNMQGDRCELTIKVKPLDDASIITMVEANENLFRDYTPEELEVAQKQGRGEKLTRAEQQIMNDLTKSMNGGQNYTERFNTIKKFICNTCSILFPNGHETAFTVELLNQFRFNDVMSLYMKVEDIVGASADSNDKLFPTSE